MIEVKGTETRSFYFPAPIEEAFFFYNSLPRIVPFLPRIFLIDTADERHHRVVYRSVELNAYHVEIYCDLEVNPDERNNVLYIQGYDGRPHYPPVKTKVGLTEVIGMGDFEITSRFYEAGQRTKIDYSLTLHSEIHRPFGLNFMPTAVLSNIVMRIVNYRIKEIVDHFVVASTKAYPKWVANGAQKIQ
jgi:hypothetical protein